MGRTRERAVLAIIVIMVALATGAATAQNATPQPAPSAAAALPPAAAFGEGWTLLATPGFAALPAEAFRDGANGIYGGPDGARLLVTVLLVADGGPALRSSWIAGNQTVDNYLNQVAADPGREAALAQLPPPAGCTETRRTDGLERIVFDTFPVGMTLCAVDPDLLVLVVASGEVAGLSGYQLSDAALSITLANRPPRTVRAGTPAP